MKKTTRNHSVHDIVSIMADINNGMERKRIARKYGLSTSAIYSIRDRFVKAQKGGGALNEYYKALEIMSSGKSSVEVKPAIGLETYHPGKTDALEVISQSWDKLGEGIKLLISDTQAENKKLAEENTKLKAELEKLKDLAVGSNWIDALRKRLS